MRKFKAEYRLECWQCGDGCCSDSWQNAQLFEDGKYVNERDEIRHIYDEEDAREHANEWVQNTFDLEEGEYELELDYEGY